MKKHIILFGLPRSGTTWLSEVLTCTDQLAQVHEPDNEKQSLLAYFHKAGLPRFPYLRADDESEKYKELFNAALHKSVKPAHSYRHQLMFKIFAPSREKIDKELQESGTVQPNLKVLAKWTRANLAPGKSRERKLIKTVHAPLAFPFLNRKFDFIPIFILRKPLNIFSSYVSIGMPDMNRRLYLNRRLLHDLGVTISAEKVKSRSNSFKAGLQIALVYRAMEMFMSKNDNIISIHYEDLLQNTEEQIMRIYEKLGLKYEEEVRNFIESKARPGTGYQTNRVLKNQKDVWKKRLHPKQVSQFLDGYSLVSNTLYPVED